MKAQGFTPTKRRFRSVGIGCISGWAVLGLLMIAWQGRLSPARAEAAATQPKRAKDATAINPPRQPSAAEILQALMKKQRNRPAIMPSTPGKRLRRPSSAPTTRRAVRPGRSERPMRLDGTMIVDRIGRLVQRDKDWFFAFESEGKVLREPPMQILPNRDLEIMETASANATRPVKFRISGEVTEYRGANYLLLRKVLIVHDLGNLK